MDQELILDGKKFISSKRLSLETGYAGDYISRLCRDKKIEGKLVGRNWYVNLDSLLNHQKESYEKKSGSSNLSGVPDRRVHFVLPRSSFY